ncbi:MAG TPA: hypothetical protein VGA18_01700 [Rhodothermales bacterium]
MRNIAYLIVITLGIATSGCDQPPPVLTEGKWTGAVVPLNHPDLRSEVYYRVSYEGQDLTILIGMMGMESRAAREVVVTTDSLKFVFDEPEGDVPLDCALGLHPTGNYEGLCADSAGKSAYFTMRPPDPSAAQEA